MNSSFGMTVATSSDQERTVRVTQKGLTLMLVNRIHGLLGYDVVSHAMAMTNANRELVSFTMYKKSSANSHGQSHGQTHSHGHTSSHKSHTHSSVVTLWRFTPCNEKWYASITWWRFSFFTITSIRPNDVNLFLLKLVVVKLRCK